MRGIIPEIRKRGAELVVVGNGKAFFARAFRDEMQLEAPILLDPDLVAYQAAGLRRGMGASMVVRSALAGVRALAKGYRQTKTAGDPWQQGGVFVIRPGGEVAFAHVNEHAGDHASNERVLAAL